MYIQKINNTSTNQNFGQLKIDPESNTILKPIRKQLNLLAKDCDVEIKKFTSQLGDYTDYGIIVNVSGKNVQSKNLFKNFLNRITGANLPSVSRKIAQKCVMNENGNKEILFEADHDLIRTRTYSSVKSAIEEHNIPQYPKIDKFKPFSDLILNILSK